MECQWSVCCLLADLLVRTWQAVSVEEPFAVDCIDSGMHARDMYCGPAPMHRQELEWLRAGC